MFELKWEKNIRGDFLCGNKNGIKKKSPVGKNNCETR